MKQVFTSNFGIITEEVPIPKPGKKEILVKVYNSLISAGTETMGMRKQKETILQKIHKKIEILDKVRTKIISDGISPTINVIKKRLNPTQADIILNPIGYSNAGVVVAKGSEIIDFNVGDYVACAGSGIAAHAEYVTIPMNLAVKIPKSLSFEDASFTTIGAIAMQGIRRANVSSGETLVITGLGLLGLLAVQIAKAWGLIVVGIDLQKERVELAKSLGADESFLANDNKLEDKILQFTSGIGADAVIIYAATKSSEPSNQAIRICRKKGRVVVVGSVSMDLNREDMYKKELDFVMSTSYGPGRYDDNYEIKGQDYPIGYVRWTENRNMQEFIRLLYEKKVNTSNLITNKFTIDKSADAYKELVENSKENIAVLFSYNQKQKEVFDNKIFINAKPISKEKINVGIIGAGGFITNNHLPNILKLEKYYKLIAIAEKNPAKAKTVGKKFKPNYITTNYQELLNNKDIDLIIIGTRHNLHANFVVESIKAGKHVLVEKPLAMNYNELNEVKKAVENSDKFLTVGFNRRYSPLSIKVKEIISKTDSPIFINYRVNAGYIPKDVWVQDPVEGGGRIVGECCHFLDLFNYFFDSEIIKIQTAFIPLNGKLITSEDNLATTISYKNGSIAHLSYVCIGNTNLNKERVEIFFEKKCIVIDDFKTLEIYGKGIKNIRLKNKDKGWFRELEEFAKLIKGEKSLILPVEKAILATKETFEILREIHD